MTQQNDSDKENHNQVEIPEKELPEVRQELSKVATNPKQSILILVVICGIFGYLFFNLFFKNSAPKKEEVVQRPTEISKPAQNTVSDIPAIPQLPDPPKLLDPLEPPPPPAIPVTPTIPVEQKLNKIDELVAPPAPLPQQNIPQPIESSVLPTVDLADTDAEKKRTLAKRKSSIVLIAGVLPKKTAEQIAEEANFQNRGNMEFVLGRGKIIDAVLETGINTDFGGEVRAVIGRDVFSESGKMILIPKGSRVFGTYATAITGAYGRISIDWIRIDLPNGYVLNFSGLGVDGLGKKGAHGRVDNKYKERFSNAILMSAFNIGLANALDKVITPPASSQAATQNIALANTLQSGANAINLDPNIISEDDKVMRICASVQSAITDKTSSSYTAIALACSNVHTLVAPAPGDKLKNIMQAVTNASSALLSNTSNTVTPTQTQNASKQAFTDVTNTVKDMVTQNQFQPTITIDQGTLVKIYVNKDYKFPKAALGKSRLVQ